MNKRVLLCDDEIHILRAVEFKLKRAGFEVQSASDGQEAWEMIEKQRPDLLVTDCQMPRLDGLGLVERIRAHPATSDLPVIMLTAKGFELGQHDVVEPLKILTVLAKPFSPRELLHCVQQIVETGKLDRSGDWLENNTLMLQS